MLFLLLSSVVYVDNTIEPRLVEFLTVSGVELETGNRFVSNWDLLKWYVWLVNISTINYTLSFVSNKDNIVRNGRSDINIVFVIYISLETVSKCLVVDISLSLFPGVVGQTIRNYTPNVWGNNYEVGFLYLYLSGYLLLDSIDGVKECSVVSLLGLVSYILWLFVFPTSSISRTLLSLNKIIEYFSVNLLLDE